MPINHSKIRDKLFSKLSHWQKWKINTRVREKKSQLINIIFLVFVWSEIKFMIGLEGAGVKILPRNYNPLTKQEIYEISVTYGNVTGWPNMTDSASSVPTLHPRTPSPLTMVVCASVPTSESGNRNVFPSRLWHVTTRAWKQGLFPSGVVHKWERRGYM